MSVTGSSIPKHIYSDLEIIRKPNKSKTFNDTHKLSVGMIKDVKHKHIQLKSRKVPKGRTLTIRHYKEYNHK